MTGLTIKRSISLARSLKSLSEKGSQDLMTLNRGSSIFIFSASHFLCKSANIILSIMMTALPAKYYCFPDRPKCLRYKCLNHMPNIIPNGGQCRLMPLLAAIGSMTLDACTHCFSSVAQQPRRTMHAVRLLRRLKSLVSTLLLFLRLHLQWSILVKGLASSRRRQLNGRSSGTSFSLLWLSVLFELVLAVRSADSWGPNNRLKLPARGRSSAAWRLRARAAA